MGEKAGTSMISFEQLIIDIILVMVLFLIVIFFVLLVRKLAYRRLHARKQAWLADKQKALIYLYQTGQIQQKLLPRHTFDYKMLEEALYRRIKVDHTVQTSIVSFVRAHMLPYYRRCLRSKDEFVRMQAVQYIRRFQLVELQNELLHLLNRRISRDEKHALYITLASFHVEEVVHLLVQMNEELPELILKTVLEKLVANETITENIIQLFERFSLPMQVIVLEILRAKGERSMPYLQLLEQLLVSLLPEQHPLYVRLRIHTILAIAGFGYFPQISLLNPYFERYVSFADWQQVTSVEEKVAIAKLMGSIRQPHFQNDLLQLLSDEQYEVRRQATASLSMYRNGSAQLQEIVATTTDLRMKEVVAEWLEKNSS